MKKNGEITRPGVSGIGAGVQENEWVKEGWQFPWMMCGADATAMEHFALSWRFERINLWFGVVQGPTEEENEKREKFCSDLNRLLDRVNNGYTADCVWGKTWIDVLGIGAGTIKLCIFIWKIG